MTPIHLPFRALDRRAAIRPTRVSTESRTSLLPSASCCGAKRVREDEVRWWEALRFGAELFSSQLAGFWIYRRCSTYSSGAVGVNKAFRRRVLLRSFGNRV